MVAEHMIPDLIDQAEKMAEIYARVQLIHERVVAMGTKLDMLWADRFMPIEMGPALIESREDR